jgi:hypothetical protein
MIPQNVKVKVPIIGNSGIFSSYISAVRMLTNCKSLLREGYSKHKIFQMPDFHGWQVFVCGPELLDELMKLPDSTLSQEKAAGEVLMEDHF